MFYKTINVLCPVERNSGSCGSTSQPCSLSAIKRKASPEPESPRKRLRCASGPAQLASEAAPAKGVKRKASTERGVPNKKLKRGHTNSSDAFRGTSWKEQDGASQIPGTTNRKCPSDPSLDLQFTFNRACFDAKYVELDMLGQGGFGSVYAGRRKRDDFPVAIKHIHKDDVEYLPVVLHGKTSMVPVEVLLMLKVGAGAASVGDSAVVSVLDWYNLGWEVLLVMERPDPCETLLSYMINCGPLEEAVVKNITKQLVDAALNMHRKHVFHRDIKAENILIEIGYNGPRVRVIDFGCSCLVTEEPYFTFCGTSAYAPPEFFMHGRYEAGPTTVWQLGTLLFEMLDEEQQFTISRFISSRLFDSKDLSQDCKTFLHKCLAPDPQERATLEQLQLHPWLQAQTTTHTTPGL